jgi:hypothetical protein
VRSWQCSRFDLTNREELAVLAVRAHRHRSDVANVAAAALDAISSLDQTRARFYSELVLQWLPAAARAILETTMDIKTEFISDWSREKIAQGEAIGEARGRAEALLRILGARGIAIDDATTERVRSCTDLTQLDSWIERSLRVTAANQLFD